VESTVFNAFCWFSRPRRRFATIRRIAFALFVTVGAGIRFLKSTILKFSEPVRPVEYLGRMEIQQIQQNQPMHRRYSARQQRFHLP
jgi:hypothetical protein